jgi:hypothetical protein
VAEALELGDEAFGVAAGVVVGAEVGVQLAGERRSPRLQRQLGIGRGQAASLVFRCPCGGSRREGE